MASSEEHNMSFPVSTLHFSVLGSPCTSSLPSLKAPAHNLSDTHTYLKGSSLSNYHLYQHTALSTYPVAGPRVGRGNP